VLRMGGDERGLALTKLDLRALDFQGPGALEDDVDLVVLVGLLAVGLRCHEHVDPDFEAGRLVDDLVAARPGSEPALDFGDLEPIAGCGQTAALRNSGMIWPP
jgi:hypothetical protein